MHLYMCVYEHIILIYIYIYIHTYIIKYGLSINTEDWFGCRCPCLGEYGTHHTTSASGLKLPSICGPKLLVYAALSYSCLRS